MNLGDKAPNRERTPLREQSIAFEASKADSKDVLVEKRDNMNRMHKPRFREHKAKRTEVGTSENESRYYHHGITSNRW